MKKFYTLLAAAAVTMSAAAAPTLAPIAAPAMAKKMVRTFEPKTFDASKISAHKLQKPAVAEGEYVSFEPLVFDYSYYSIAGQDTYTGVCEFSVYNDDKAVMLRSFLDPSFVLTKGEVDEANGTLSFPAQYLTQMYDNADNVYDMWLYAAELSADGTELILLPDDPIVFLANADGSVTGLNDILVICAEGDADMAYDFAMEVAMEETDEWAKLSYTAFGLNDEGYFTEEVSESSITLHNATLENGELILSDVFMYGIYLPVAIDYAAGTATIEPQILAQFSSSLFMMIAVDGETDFESIEGVLESPNTIVWDGQWGFGALDGDYYFLGWFELNKGGKITTGFRLDGSGVKDVAVDANAPVEYYNLQGVRVAEPTNGIYIRRQGNTASKVLVVR